MGTSAMERVHQVNAYLCFGLGTGLNGTLVWLIRTKPNTELRVYSRILLQSAAVNLVFLLISAAYEPVSSDSSPSGLVDEPSMLDYY
jgi:hypothetical protein